MSQLDSVTDIKDLQSLINEAKQGSQTARMKLNDMRADKYFEEIKRNFEVKKRAS